MIRINPLRIKSVTLVLKQLDIINTVGCWRSAVDRIALLVAECLVENCFLKTDALRGRYFDAFLFENLPASDHKTDKVYLEEVARSDLSILRQEKIIESGLTVVMNVRDIHINQHYWTNLTVNTSLKTISVLANYGNWHPEDRCFLFCFR